MRKNILDNLQTLKNKLSKTVRNMPVNDEFIKVNEGYLIEERVLIDKEVKGKSIYYKLYLNDMLIMEGSLVKTKRYFILSNTKVYGEFLYLDMLYKRIENHNKKSLEDQVFNNIDVFLSK